MAGIPTATDSAPDAASHVVAAARLHGIAPVDLIAAVAQHLLVRAGLRADLAAAVPCVAKGAGVDGAARMLGEELALLATCPHELGRVWELSLTAAKRHRAGVHLTPAAIARHIVERAEVQWCRLTGPPRVHDPACGGGAFLLAALDAMDEAGVAPGQALAAVSGTDIDADAVDVADASIRLWAAVRDAAPPERVAVAAADGLLIDMPDRVDLVVGNPPFLTQLKRDSTSDARRRRELKDRWGDLVGAYTDDAWLFLAAALDQLRPGAVVAMVQPLSVLSARHGGPVRLALLTSADLTGLWVPFIEVFDAHVQVCAIIARRRDDRIGSADSAASVATSAPAADSSANSTIAHVSGGELRRWVGPDFTEAPSTSSPRPTRTSWGPLAAELHAGFGLACAGMDRRSGHGETVAKLATATAGFRDQFYGFVPHVDEVELSATGDRREPPHGSLTTVGMIDLFDLRWGTSEFSFARRKVTRPVVDLAALTAENPGLAQWCDARMRPKVLLATQTRVLEPWVDATGVLVPATPVISVEPADADDVWMIAAVLGSPQATAYLYEQNFGSALSLNALKFAASDVLSLALPRDREPWVRAAAIVEQLHVRGGPHGHDRQRRVELLGRFADEMANAYRSESAALTSWWLNRIPDRPAADLH